MKRNTLVEKLYEEIRKPNAHQVTLGEVSLAVEILKQIKERSPYMYKRVKKLIP